MVGQLEEATCASSGLASLAAYTFPRLTTVLASGAPITGRIPSPCWPLRIRNHLFDRKLNQNFLKIGFPDSATEGLTLALRTVQRVAVDSLDTISTVERLSDVKVAPMNQERPK